MWLTAAYYRHVAGWQRYAEYSIRMIAITLAGIVLLTVLAWQLTLGADDSVAASAAGAGRLKSTEAGMARSAAQHTWQQYRRHSWGANELAPASKGPSRGADSLVGSRSGLTIVEGLVTLHLMRLDEEYLQAQEWIDSSFDFTNTTASVSTAETSARLLGGLLSAFSMTEHPPFLFKALQVAEGLLAAFQTPSGLPASLAVPFQGPTAAGRLIRLDQMSRLYLEFAFLHRLTGLQKYADAAAGILEPLARHMKAKSAAAADKETADISPAANDTSDKAVWTPPAVWDVRTGAPTTEPVDSSHQASGLLALVEVAIKAHLLLDGDRSALQLFRGLLAGRLRLEAWLSCRPGVKECRFNLTACRLVETLLLSLGQSRDPIVQRDLAHQLGDLCLSAMQVGHAHFAAQPEPVLAGLLLWSRRRRVSHQQLLGRALLSISQQLQEPIGYQGVRRRVSPDKRHQELQPDSLQPGHLLGQTLKYIYMAFEPERLNLISGDWVFNTAGQLLPVCGSRRFDRLRQVVRDNWPELRRRLADLARLTLTRRRERPGVDYDGWSNGASSWGGPNAGLMLVAAVAALMAA